LKKCGFLTEKLGIKPDPDPKLFIPDPDPDPSKGSGSTTLVVPHGIVGTLSLIIYTVFTPSNGANVFCFLSSLPLLPPATTAVFGSYLSSLYS
jgi:hypothetical protein